MRRRRRTGQEVGDESQQHARTHDAIQPEAGCSLDQTTPKPYELHLGGLFSSKMLAVTRTPTDIDLLALWAAPV